MACNPKKIEVNQVAYPGTPDCPVYDTVQNWPATTEVSQATGEDITRNRDALLILERILGLNPHIGLFTIDPRTATVSQRISILEQGISEGRFELKTLKVDRAIETIKDVHDRVTLLLGAYKTADHEATPVEFRGPIKVLASGAKESRALFEVGFVVRKSVDSNASTDCLIEGSSIKGKPLLRITDFNRTEITDKDHIALAIDGNLHVNGFITGEFALDHSRLNNINTDPVIDAGGAVILDAIHVSRGNFHSHKRGEYNPALGRWTVDPNPREATYGLINHIDLEPESTRTSIRQQNFIPDPNVAYHVTNGDDHDHVGGDGAPLRHKFLLGIDPKNSNHVTSGDFHTHNPEIGDGALIPTHGIILQKDLEEILLGISEFAPSTNLSEVLAAISGRLIGIDELNQEQNERLEQNEADINDAKISKQDLNLVRADVSSLKADVSRFSTDLIQVKEDIETNATDIETLKQRQISAAIFGVTVTELNINQGLFGIGGITGQAVTITLDLQGNVTYQDATGDPPVIIVKNASVNFAGSSATGVVGPLPSALRASTLIPRKGVLKNFVVRATQDLPSGAVVPVSIWVNGNPTPISLTLVETGEPGIPAPVIDNISEFEVETGDLITFGYYNQGSAAITGISLMSAISLVALDEEPPPPPLV